VEGPLRKQFNSFHVPAMALGTLCVFSNLFPIIDLIFSKCLFRSKLRTIGVVAGEPKSATQGERGAVREDGGNPAWKIGGAGKGAIAFEYSERGSRSCLFECSI
jgi:hypothetical protein